MYVPRGYLQQQDLEMCYQKLRRLVVDKTYDFVNRKYYLPEMCKNVRAYVTSKEGEKGGSIINADRCSLFVVLRRSAWAIS